MQMLVGFDSGGPGSDPPRARRAYPSAGCTPARAPGDELHALGNYVWSVTLTSRWM